MVVVVVVDVVVVVVVVVGLVVGGTQSEIPSPPQPSLHAQLNHESYEVDLTAKFDQKGFS